jgi:TolB-like protein
LVIVAGYFIWESRFQTNETTPDNIASPTSTETERVSANPEQAISKDGSIAVLPFANRSRDEDDVFFSDGIHDDLLTQLAKIDDLKVISRTSVMKYRDTQQSIPEIAAELGVSTILEGGIQRAGKRIRINAQLIDVRTDEHLWAETFDREMTIENLFEIQSEITRQIVTAVKGELSDAEQVSLNSAPTDNLEAYEAYLHARTLMYGADYSSEKYIAAQPWAERATQLDPDFAQAWAQMAEIHAQAVWIGYDNTPERRTAAAAALDRALELDPTSIKVMIAQADHFYRFKNDYPAALKTLEQALKLAPGNVEILFNMALTQRRLGLWDESIASFERASQLDPGNGFISSVMIETLANMNRWNTVDRQIDQLIRTHPESMDLMRYRAQAKIFTNGDLKLARELFDLLQPSSASAYTGTASILVSFERDFDAWLALQESAAFLEDVQFGPRVELSKGIIYHLKGDTERANTHLRNQVDIILERPTTTTFVDAFIQSGLATSWSYLNEHEKALQASIRAMEMMPQEKDHIFGTFVAQTHTLILARAGKRDEALERLTSNIDRPEGLTRWGLYFDPQWDFFRDDERFNALATPTNLKESGQ